MTIALKTDPKYGYYPWWPAPDDNHGGDDWLHPEDVELARSLLPSPRVWRRDGQQGPFVVLTYGKLLLRVRRTLWRELKWEGFDIGDLVEVRTRGMKNQHRTATIQEMLWDDHAGAIHYQLQDPDEVLDNPQNYTAEDLKQVEATDGRPEVRVEPKTEDEEGYEVERSSDDA